MINLTQGATKMKNKKKKVPKPVSMSSDLYERAQAAARLSGMNFSQFVCECLETILVPLERGDGFFELLEKDFHERNQTKER